MRSLLGRGARGFAPMIAAGCGLVAGCALYSTPRGDDDGEAPQDAGGFVDAVAVQDAGPGLNDAAAAFNPGFVTPSAVTRANERVGSIWQEIEDADWSCMAQARNEPTPVAPMTLTGTVRDFASESGVVAAMVELLSAGSSIGAAVSSDAGGYRLQAVSSLSATQSRVDLVLRATGSRVTLVRDRYLGPAPVANVDPVIFSDATANALPAFVGVLVPPGTTLVVGTIRDCRGRMVSNAAVTVSVAADFPAHVDGAQTFYFSAGGTSLPVRNAVAATTNRDGKYLVLGMPGFGSEAYAQVWGFRTAAELAGGVPVLLGRSPVLLLPDAVNALDTDPLRR